MKQGDMRTKESSRWLPLWFIPSVIVLAVFTVSFARIVYWNGELSRHCTYDCGDGYRATGFHLAAGSLLLIGGGLMVRIVPAATAGDSWTRAYLQLWEAVIGAIAILWLLMTFGLPFPIVTIPVGLFGLFVAGLLRRVLRGEAPPRRLLPRCRSDEFLACYVPHLVTAAVFIPFLLVGLALVGSGGACHEYPGSSWSQCGQDGSALRSVVLIGFLTLAAGLTINLGYRLRAGRPRSGWLIAIPTGLVFAGAVIASHLIS